MGAAHRSILDQDYPGRLEALAVDDRSTAPARSPPGSRSNGPEGLTRCGRDGLPECWLGKNHALYLGTEADGGEWLLFTDTDVRLSAGCVEDAIRYAAREDLGHLTLTPELISWGGPEELRGGLRPSLRDYAEALAVHRTPGERVGGRGFF